MSEKIMKKKKKTPLELKHSIPVLHVQEKSILPGFNLNHFSLVNENFKKMATNLFESFL